jgi:heme/copper-type cytochrome/quinol oxidase subunit 2
MERKNITSQKRSVAKQYLIRALGSLVVGSAVLLVIPEFLPKDFITIYIVWFCVACVVVVFLVLLLLSLLHATVFSHENIQRDTKGNNLIFYLLAIILILIWFFLKYGFGTILFYDFMHGYSIF